MPLINGSRDLPEWWAGGPRWQLDDRVNDPAAPLFPSERRHGDDSSRPVTDDALRTGLAEAVAAHLPGQAGRLTPHYAASDACLRIKVRPAAKLTVNRSAEPNGPRETARGHRGSR